MVNFIISKSKVNMNIDIKKYIGEDFTGVSSVSLKKKSAGVNCVKFAHAS